jgi:magnesium-transporting ATPase (P-type)
LEKLPWYEQSIEEVSANLGTDPSNGLSPGEVKLRLEKYGSNELEHKKDTTGFSNVSRPAEGLYGYHSAGSQSGIHSGRGSC